MKKLLPTSTAGSLPKPSWLAEPETLWSPWKLQDGGLLEGKQDALRLSLQEQQHAGIDIVSDGEQTRQHFVTTFIEHLDGVDFENRKTVRIRDRYDASVPTVMGAVARKKPVFVEDAKFLRQHPAGRKVGAAGAGQRLPGPGPLPLPSALALERETGIFGRIRQHVAGPLLDAAHRPARRHVRGLETTADVYKRQEQFIKPYQTILEQWSAATPL